MAAALFGFFFLSTLYLQTILGYGPLKAGAAFIPGIAVMLGIAGAASSFVARTGVRPLVATGTAIASVGMLLLSQLTPHSSYLTGVMLPMIVLCAGLGLTFVPTMLSAVSGVKDEHSGLVSGVSTTATQIGGSIGVAVLASVAATASRSQPLGTPIHTALARGYTHAYQISALIIAAAIPVAVAALRLRPTHQHAATTSTTTEAAYELA
jgi:hypothetical protein